MRPYPALAGCQPGNPSTTTNRRVIVSTTYRHGRYRARVLEQGFAESPVKGTPGFFLQLLVLGRYDEQGRPQECPQYERTYTQYLANDTRASILKGDLRAIGVEITDLAQLHPESPNPITLVGREIDVVCEIEARDGRDQERWGIVRSRRRLDTSAIRDLSAQFGHLFQTGNG